MISKFDILIFIAEETDLYGTLTSSTISIAKTLCTSQQTISRRIKELHDQEYIEYNSYSTGSKIILKDKGVQYLRLKESQLKKIFKQRSKFKGSVISGVGEGKYYVKKYKTKMKEQLGFAPYEGTLNIKIENQQLKRFISNMQKITINEFKTKDRTFGAVDCYKININDKINGALVIPKRNIHPEDTVEIVAPSYLRKILDIKDNDIIKITKDDLI